MGFEMLPRRWNPEPYQSYLSHSACRGVCISWNLLEVINKCLLTSLLPLFVGSFVGLPHRFLNASRVWH